MNLCSFKWRMAELLAQQPVLSGAVVYGACVCGRICRVYDHEEVARGTRRVAYSILHSPLSFNFERDAKNTK